MEIENKKKKIIVTSIVIGIVLLLGVAYAWFNYYKEGSNQRLILADIYLKLNDNNDQITINNILNCESLSYDYTTDYPVYLINNGVKQFNNLII